ncbi:MAG TPA: hypothetical protein VNP73_04350 [Actinomycetota bacterium]|nr:hypothetical protein [Actinomycetota bacterium]
MNRDFLRGVVVATLASLFLHALVPVGGPGPARVQRRGHQVARLGPWAVPRDHRERNLDLATLTIDRARIRVRPAPAGPEPKTEAPRLAAYRGLGSWIDIFNTWVWDHPWATVSKMHDRGVETIYLQTATHGSTNPVVHPKVTKQFLLAAHRHDMRVVGWYVPSFARPGRDYRRSLFGLRFGAKKHGFDSFALDIEATNVDNIHKRNVRLLWMAKRLRRAAAPGYPLGAIIPDSHSLYWPDFPYKRVASIFDVMVPMGYFTFRAEGYKHVQRYTENNIRTIRKETGRKTPIHVIGGLADEVGVPAARGFAKAVRKKRVLGASLYDYPITDDKTWDELAERIP